MDIKIEEELLKELQDMALVTALSLTKYLIDNTDVGRTGLISHAFVNKLIAVMRHNTVVPNKLGMTKTLDLVSQVNKTYDMATIIDTIKEFEIKADKYVSFLTKTYSDNIPVFDRSDEMSSIMQSIYLNYHDEVYVIDQDSQYKVKLNSENCDFYEIHEGNRISLLLLLKEKLAIYELFRLNHMNSIKTDDSSEGAMVYAVRIPFLQQANSIEEVILEIHDLVNSMSGAMVHKVINPYLKES